MKKFYYLATALLVLAGAAGCKKNADVQDPELQPSGKMRTVTISAGQASEKTSVNHGVITWSANDKLFITSLNGPGVCGLPLTALNITSGVGTTQGTFTGEIDASIEDDTQLLACCGGDWTSVYQGGEYPYVIYLTIPTTQTYVADGIYENTFPSIGVGTINDGIPMLNNVVAGVLCLNVKGETTDKVKSITVSANNKFAGKFGISPEMLPDPGASEVTLTCPAEGVALSPEGSKFYIVAFSNQSCAFTVTVTKTDDTSFECSLGDAFEVTAGSVTTKDVADGPAADYGKCSVSDYTQVTIGGQTWMAENYACRKYDTDAVNSELTAAFKAAYADASGNIVVPVSASRTYNPYYADATTATKPDYMTEQQMSKLGYHYGWAAVVGVADGESQTTAFTGNRQGICPNGWHVPAKTEWQALRDYIEVTLGKGADTVGKHLKTTSGWKNSGNGTDDYDFAALPAGYSYDGFEDVGKTADFWTSTIDDSQYACDFSLYYGEDKMKTNGNKKKEGRSLRCIKN